MRWRLRALDEVVSTNDEVKRAIEAGEGEGLAVRARRQSGGYGRDGRAWSSPAGGLYVSLLLRPSVPASQLPMLSLVAGLAVREALASLAGEAAERIQVKWPNDVVVTAGAEAAPGAAEADAAAAQAAGGGARAARPDEAAAAPKPFRKLCGISAEAHGGAVCVGIGVNVARPAEAAPVGGKNEPAYLVDLADADALARAAAPAAPGAAAPALAADDTAPAGDAASVAPVPDALASETLARILAAFEAAYERWKAEGFAPFAASCNACFALADRPVSIVDRAGRSLAAGAAFGVDAQGRLLVRAADGSVHAVASGEAHLV